MSVYLRLSSKVINVIEEAIQSATSPAKPAVDLDAGHDKHPPTAHPASAMRPSYSRLPSSRDGARPDATRRTSVSNAPPSATDKESWRSKVHLPSQNDQEPTPVSAPARAPPPLLATVETLVIEPDEDLEVVDFSELGKLMGSEHNPSNIIADVQPATHFPPRHPRPTAVDFFDDSGGSYRPNHRESVQEGSWRRRQSSAKDVTLALETHDVLTTSPNNEKFSIHTAPSDTTKSAGDESSVASSAVPSVHAHDDSSRSFAGPSHFSQPYPGQSRMLLGPQYREAPMATLDVVMSRIKGALDGMHTKPEPPKEKWLPPALRPKPSSPTEYVAKPTEVFDATMSEPPRSPRPWDVYNVKLPQVSRPVDPTPPKRIYVPKYFSHVRWDIFSWDPPPEGFFRRGFDYNDLNFRRPHYINHRLKYNVKLPRSRPTLDLTLPPAPVVNLPISPVTRTGKHSVQQVAPAANPSSGLSNAELDTFSGSPSLSVPSTTTNGTSLPKADSVSAVDTNDKSSKQRMHQKMPAGSDVAFYRDSRVEVVTQPTVTVNFIVTSEIEQEANGVEQAPVSSANPSTSQQQASLQASEIQSDIPPKAIITAELVREVGEAVKAQLLVSIPHIGVSAEFNVRDYIA